MTENKPRILCADDDPEWRELLAQWLKPYCEFDVCSRGADVPARVKSFRPDCVVLDYELGDMRGSQVCAQLKAMPEISGVPVLIMTSLAASMVTAVKEGAPDHFVVKSPSSLELLSVLRTLLASKGFAGGLPN